MLIKIRLFVTDKIINDAWSPDTCVGSALSTGAFNRTEIVCTKTLYSNIDLGILKVKNFNLHLKLRRSTKPSIVRKNKKNLGRCFEERPEDISTRETFGHWEIDTVVGVKSRTDCVLLTMYERQTRNAIVRQIASKTADAVMAELKNIQAQFGDKFSKVFKSITSDNGSEFAELAAIEGASDADIYFTHRYSSFERVTNERHNGLIRRFIPKGKRIVDYNLEDIAFIEEWMNTLPRRILGYKTPESLFEDQLDIIYAT